MGTGTCTYWHHQHTILHSDMGCCCIHWYLCDVKTAVKWNCKRNMFFICLTYLSYSVARCILVDSCTCTYWHHQHMILHSDMGYCCIHWYLCDVKTAVKWNCKRNMFFIYSTYLSYSVARCILVDSCTCIGWHHQHMILHSDTGCCCIHWYLCDVKTAVKWNCKRNMFFIYSTYLSYSVARCILVDSCTCIGWHHQHMILHSDTGCCCIHWYLCHKVKQKLREIAKEKENVWSVSIEL